MPLIEKYKDHIVAIGEVRHLSYTVECIRVYHIIILIIRINIPIYIDILCAPCRLALISHPG